MQIEEDDGESRSDEQRTVGKAEIYGITVLDPPLIDFQGTHRGPEGQYAKANHLTQIQCM